MNRLLVLASLVLLVSMGSFEAPSWTGKIAVKGNEPFTFLALTTSEGKQWRLDGRAVKELWAAQGRWVKVTGQAKANGVIVVDTWAWARDEGNAP